VSPPDWVEDLIYAEKWGIKPWEMDDVPAIWIERQQLFDHFRKKLMKHG